MAVWQSEGDHFDYRGLRDRTSSRTLIASSQSDSGIASGLVVLGLVAAWVATYAMGGSKTVAPHCFYFPVLLASIRFGHRGALAVAIVAGLAVGPFMPLDVMAGTVQNAENWIARLVIFAVIGQVTAYLVRHSLPSVHVELDGRRIRQEVASAVERGEFYVEYQPIVRLETGEVAGVEALIRWEHPTRGLLSPATFIPVAERAGCIGAITRYVVDQACRDVVEWRDAGVLGDREFFKVAVNISAGELGDRELPVEVGDALARTGLPAHWLHLEVTETALVADLESAVDGLMALRMVGVRLAIDDFGTGESSLAHLHRFPIDVLKIDRSFLEPLGQHERGTVLAHGVIALAHAMGLVPVVEGVETLKQAAVLRDLGCDLAQGFLFSRPVAPAELQRLLLSGRRLPETTSDVWGS